MCRWIFCCRVFALEESELVMMVACGGLRGRGSDAYTLVFVGVVYESCHAAAFDYVHCDVFVGLCGFCVSLFVCWESGSVQMIWMSG